MFSIKKGEIGYRSRLKRQYLVLAVLLFLCAGVQFYMKSFFSERQQLLITASMLITAFPAALLAARLLSIMKFNSLTPERYAEYQAYETEFSLLYELLITSADQILPMDVIVIHPTGSIYAYCTESGIRVQRAEQEINETLHGQNLKVQLRISTEKKTFDKRLQRLKPASEYEPNEQLSDVIAVLKAMSM